jgi:hypothetical protein
MRGALFIQLTSENIMKTVITSAGMTQVLDSSEEYYENWPPPTEDPDIGSDMARDRALAFTPQALPRTNER